MHRIKVIDSHTGGEPTRLVLEGFPDLGPGNMAERRTVLATWHDAWRRATMLEPRGNDVIVGALLCEPLDPANAAGVIFFNNAGMLGMCGHGSIGVVASLAYLGRLQPGVHGIETPVGTVQATLHDDGSVSVRNVPSYRLHKRLTLDVPGYGDVVGDVAWGGNWFFLVAERPPETAQAVKGSNLAGLTQFALAVQRALEVQGVRGAGGALIDHIEVFADDDDGDDDDKVGDGVGVGTAKAAQRADSRNFVLCPGGAYDRSPCGTGTSAKLACLAADGALQPGQVWRQASIIGSQFEASFEWLGDQIIPTIRGRAHMSAEATLLVDPSDPFAWGIML